MNKAGRTNRTCIMLGGGGHAGVVLDCLQASRRSLRIAILDRNPALWKKTLLGIPISGGDNLIPGLIARGVRRFVVAVGSNGDTGPRRRLFNLARSHGLTPLTVRHPSSVCSPSARIGAGCQLLPTCVVNAGAVVGNNVIVNSGAIVEHDCVVGHHAHVATGARLCGAVVVGDSTHVGAGATVKEGIKIGANAVIGAGAMVIRDVPAGAVVVGVPARPLRKTQRKRKTT